MARRGAEDAGRATTSNALQHAWGLWYEVVADVAKAIRRDVAQVYVYSWRTMITIAAADSLLRQPFGTSSGHRLGDLGKPGVAPGWTSPDRRLLEFEPIHGRPPIPGNGIAIR